MPHQLCSVCRHPAREKIDAELLHGESIRVIAGRHGLSKTVLHRHAHHRDHAQVKASAGELKRIDAEISKLIRSQTAAKKRRDNSTLMSIAKELRAWHTLRQKAVAAVAASEPDQQRDGLSERDALQLAMSIIAASLAAKNPETLEWLRSLSVWQSDSGSDVSDSSDKD